MKFRWIRYIAERLPKEIRERRKTEIEACFTGTKKQLEEKVLNLKKKVRIALVGKYVELPDAYISVVEALKHAGYPADTDIDLKWVQSNDVTPENAAELLGDADGIIVPGGFGPCGTEGKIAAIQYARENDVPDRKSVV